MLHTNNPIIKHKAGLLNLAEELGNPISAQKPEEAIDFDTIRSMIYQQAKQARPKVEQHVTMSTACAHRNLSEAELTKYEAFLMQGTKTAIKSAVSKWVKATSPQ